MVIKHDPKAQLIHQVNNLYFDGVSEKDHIAIDNAYQVVVERLDNCFSNVKNKYYHNNGLTIFNPLHIAQWTTFLYYMANQMRKMSDENVDICDKIYGVSKCFSSADIYYEVELPNIWFFDHPQGSVLGRAKYSNYFSFSQGCTVGNNKGKYPKFDEHVSMMSGSKILGNCNIGHHVIMSANSYIIDQDVPSYSIVFGASRDVIIKPISPEKFNELTEAMF